MIYEIELTNFKAIGETVKIPIKPITLIFGANSSGKSSIIRCLTLLAQQSIENSFSTKGSIIDVGSFKNLIHNHDFSKEFSVKFNFSIPADLLPWTLYKILDEKDKTRVAYNWDAELFSDELNEDARIFKKSLEKFKTGGLRFIFVGDGNRLFTKSIQLFLGNDPEYVFEYENQELFFNQNHEYWKEYIKLFVIDYKRVFKSNSSDEIYRKIAEIKAQPEHLAEDFQRHIDQFLGEYDELGLIIADRYINAIDHDKPSEYNDFLERLSHGSVDMFKEFPRWTKLIELKSNQSILVKLLEKKFSATSNAETFLDENFPPKYTGQEEMTLLDLLRLKDTSDYIVSSSYELSNPLMLILLFSDIINDFFRNFSYIPPIRQVPDRYFFGDDTQNNAFLKKVIRNDKKEIELINAELNRLEANYQFKVVKYKSEIDTEENIHSLQFYNTKTGVSSSIKDIGFGFSQLLPILVEGCASTSGKILIEQPELHLHPAMQSQLGDFFIRSSKSKTFFLETHSEHLILRLLRRIRETTNGELPDDVPSIKPDDIAVLYVQLGEKGAEVIHIPITEDGDFSRPWPQGFFSERIKELF